MKPSLIEQGFYYEKAKNGHGWLRYVIRVHGHEVTYADFTGIGQCGLYHFNRWASRRLTKVEACIEFADEVRKIGSIMRKAATADPPWLTGLLAAHPRLTREKALEEMIKEFGG
jgi:hypothetical protein